MDIQLDLADRIAEGPQWVYWFMGVIAISLIFDYIDVVRYFMGDTQW